jgi:hypothetical protein
MMGSPHNEAAGIVAARLVRQVRQPVSEWLQEGVAMYQRAERA